MDQQKQAFITGNPIKHSKSPLLHGYWLKKYEIAGSYRAVETDESALAALFDAVRTGTWQGGNVTLPHKQLAFDLVDARTERAQKIGAVNTVWLQDGQLWGDNTDGHGFLANLDHQLPGWAEHNKIAIVLGAGGAARAVLCALVEKGFQKIYLLNRTLERAQQLAAEIKGPIEAQTLETFNQLAPSANLVVNTSSIGMQGTKFDNLHVDKLPKTAIVTDIVYTPLITPLLADAKAEGLKIATGLGMLLFQAVPGFEHWFGVKPVVDQALTDHILAEVQNG